MGEPAKVGQFDSLALLGRQRIEPGADGAALLGQPHLIGHVGIGIEQAGQRLHV